MICNKIDLSNISIIIAVRIDCNERLLNLKSNRVYLDSVATNLDIIYVENDTESKIQNHIYPEDTLIFNELDDNYNLCKSYNVGAVKSKRPFLCFLDVDCITNMEDVLICTDPNNYNGGLMFPYNSFLLFINKAISNNIRDNISLEILRTLHTGTSRTNSGSLFKNAQGGCLLIKREIHINIGGFNPNFKGLYWQDVEYQRRLHKLGYPVTRFTKATDILYHMWHDRSATPINQILTDYNRELAMHPKRMTKAKLEEYIKTWDIYDT